MRISATKKIIAGVIGTGFVGPVHIENLRRLPNVEVGAIASHSKERAIGIANRLGINKAYGDWKAIVGDDEIDVIHIATSNELHYPIARECLEAGKHVICEKPLAMDSKEAKKLAVIARVSDCVNATTFNMDFYPMVRQAREMVKNGELGRLFLVHGSYLQDWLSRDTDYNWRVESKYSGKSRVISDICSHWFQMVQRISGKRILSVFADSTIFIPLRKKPRKILSTQSEAKTQIKDHEIIQVDTEDHVSIMFRFEDNIKGTLIASQTCPGRKQRIFWEINGSEKSLCWNGEEPNTLWVGNRSGLNGKLFKDPNFLYEDAARYSNYPVGLAEGYPDSWKNLFSSIYNHIGGLSNGKEADPDFPTFEDGYRIQVLIDSVIESVQRERWVEVKY